MKFLLVVVFVFNGHVYHKETPYQTMNECVKAKQLVKDEFKLPDKGKLLSVICKEN